MDIHTKVVPQQSEVEGGSSVLPSIAPAALERLLAQFRPFLRSLAEHELPQELQAKLDPSDLVQETLFRGFRQYEQYRGSSERELTAWLTEILRNYLKDVRRGYQRGVRDVRREHPFVDLPCPSSSTASSVARQRETSEILKRAMEQLPDEYRKVLDLRQSKELTFPEIGVRMDRSADAARMLWGRAILQLGNLLRTDDV